MLDTQGNFFIGRIYDPAKKKLLDKPLLYDPDDLTTHAVVTGMTGSGKTGLCIGLMEEAALQGIPALIVDPKGDQTNLLLHFPGLAAQDFHPWIDTEVARRNGQTLEQAAEQAAQQWQSGLADWGIGRERLQALQKSVQFTIFTPGSDAGIPVSVLSSLEAPSIPWEGNRDILRERITSTVTALLGLVGFNNIDPLRSREHILLANIFEQAWSQNRNLDLTELILQTQTPPFDKLGAFPLQTFFPEKDRMELALTLNNILASPTFEIWREGQPLDVPGLLYTADGRPRHSLFYMAHLSEPERMFFVTLLLSSIETWMRTQAGVSTLRTLLYFDEIFGYMPPLSNPPSKPPLLRLLKQARAFGLGLLLATQNPVDVDYKALSNAGTWFIGKLQTDQDKQRLLDGLESAGGGFDRHALDVLISGLGKRVFLMHNVHENKPVVFQTRWAMNFLPGPLTRAQIPMLNRLAGAGLAGTASPVAVTTTPKAKGKSKSKAKPVAEAVVPVPEAPPPVAKSTTSAGSLTRPAVPIGIEEYFLPVNMSLPEAVNASGQTLQGEIAITGMYYHPVLLASAQVRFLDRRYGLDTEIKRSVLVLTPDRRGVVRWEDFLAEVPDIDKMDTGPAPQSRFAVLETPLADEKLMAALQRDFTDWIYRTTRLSVRANQKLGLYATPDVSQAEFMRACADAAREARDAELAKVTAGYDRQIEALRNRLSREDRELRQDETELQQRKWEEMGTHAENVLGLFGGRRSTRRLSSSLSKRRMTEQAKSDVEESVEVIQQYKQQLAELEQARQQAVQEATDRWGNVVNDITEIALNPKKTDIFVNIFGVAWMPYYLVKAGINVVEIPAFQEEK